jgi:hypothetical protein
LKAKSNLKEITKEQAEKLLKQENEKHIKDHHNHDHTNDLKSSSPKKISNPKNTKSTAKKTSK